MSFIFPALCALFCGALFFLIYMLCAERFFPARRALPLGICAEFISLLASRKRRGYSLVDNLLISPLILLTVF